VDAETPNPGTPAGGVSTVFIKSLLHPENTRLNMLISNNPQYIFFIKTLLNVLNY
jgi:hypothetical protein